MTRTGPFSPRGRHGDPFATLRQEFARVAEDLGRFGATPPVAPGAARMALARVDMSETEDAVDIEIEAPGVEDDGLALDLRGDVLTIRATRETRRDAHDRAWHLRERAVSGMTRALTLPFTLDPAAISARLEHGVLHVHVPKSRDPGARRVKIPIRRDDDDADTDRSGQRPPRGASDPAI